MKYQLKNIESGECIEASIPPVWSKCGVWNCGDQLVADANGDLHAAVIEMVPLIVSPIQFKLLFKGKERIAIAQMRASTSEDLAQVRLLLDDFYGILDDPRLTGVDLSLASTQEGLDQVLTLLHSLKVVEDIVARKAEILTGVIT